MAKLDSFPKSLQKFKDIHKGEDCIIMGSGPSLSTIPHEFLKRYKIIGANASWKYFKPDYITVGDVQYSWFKPTRKFAVENNIPFFVCWAWKGKNGQELEIDNKNEISMPFDPSKNKDRILKTYNDPNYIEKSGVTSFVTVVAEMSIPLALYMGFENIYLAGIDFKDIAHFYEDSPQDIGEFKKWEKANGGLWEVKKYAMEMIGKSDIKNRVFNLNPDSAIESIKKISYEEVDDIKQAKEVFDIEISQLNRLKQSIDASFSKAVKLLKFCKNVIVTGVGKTGIIGQKISATLSSTGTPSVFINSNEALHGDLGIVTSEDVVIIISNSGNTEETVKIIEPIKRIGAKIISLTGNPESSLAKQSDVSIYCGVEKEACPLHLAPTSSTTSTLLMGDALAVVLMKLKEFKKEDFAKFHPAGALGKLLKTVKDTMEEKDVSFTVAPEDTLATVILKLNENKKGAVCVLENSKLLGFISDGDIRRILKSGVDIFSLSAKDVMNRTPITVRKDDRLIDILSRNLNITVAPVIDEDNNLIGIVRLV